MYIYSLIRYFPAVPLKRFEESRVFITGASSGIGAALGIALAAEGAHVALAARNEDRLKKVQAEIEAFGGNAITIVCDVTDRSSLDHAIELTVEAFGGIDLAIANAGFGVNGMFEDLSTDDFRRQFDTNVYGVIDTIYTVLPHLKKSKGQLGIVSSIMGRVGAPASSAYCASKFALCGLAESLYYELEEEGVSVTLINPGVVESNFRFVDNQGIYHDGQRDPAPKFLIVPVEKAIRKILEALYKRKFEAVITAHGKLITWMSRHFPRSFRLFFKTVMKGRLKELMKQKRGRS